MEDSTFEKVLGGAKKRALAKKGADVTQALKTTASRTRNTVVRVKVGRLAIAAIKASLKRTPKLPEQAKALLDSEYADIVIGAVVPVIVPMLTSSPNAIRLSEDVNIAGGVVVADKLVFIDNFVKGVIDSVTASVLPGELDDNEGIE